MRALFSAIVLLISFSAEARCLDSKDVQAIQKEVQIQIPGGSETLFCDQHQNLYRLFETLIFLKNKSFPQFESVFSRHVLPENLWDYFRARIKVIQNDDPCPVGKLASVRLSSPGEMHLCPSFYDDQISMVERLPTMIHEAHHFDGDGFPHVHCRHGRLIGMRSACDASLEQGGGYAVEIEMLLRLAAMKDGGLSLEEVSRAKNMALVRTAENFNLPFLSYQPESVYLISMDGKAFLLNPVGGQLKEVKKLDQDRLTLVSRGTGFSVFPKDGQDTYALDMLSPALLKMSPQGTISADYNQQPLAKRPAIQNIFNDAHFSGFITKHFVSIAFGDNNYSTEFEVSFEIKSSFTGEEAGTGEDDTIYLIGPAGAAHRVQFHPGRTYQMTDSGNPAQGFRSLAVFQKGRLGLADDGILKKEVGGAWVPVPGAQSKKFLFMSRPFYWSPDLFTDKLAL